MTQRPLGICPGIVYHPGSWCISISYGVRILHNGFYSIYQFILLPIVNKDFTSYLSSLEFVVFFMMTILTVMRWNLKLVLICMFLMAIDFEHCKYLQAIGISYLFSSLGYLWIRRFIFTLTFCNIMYSSY